MSRNSGDFYEEQERKKPLRFLKSVVVVFLIIFGIFIILNPDFFDKDLIKLSSYKKSTSNESTEIEMTKEQERAINIVENYLGQVPFSKKQILNITSSYYPDIFSKEDVEFAFEYLGVDWKEKALELAYYNSEKFYYSKNITEATLRDENTGFEDDEVEYAMENLEINWKENALNWAQQRGEQLNLSKKALYDYLVYDRGGGFTEEEAIFAIERVDIDWKNNALNQARDLLEYTDMDERKIYKNLISNDIGRFTEEEANYAIENLQKEEIEKPEN